MYFDTVSFSKSIKTYTEPLGRIVRDIIYTIPKMLTEVRKSISESWTNGKPKTVGGALSYIIFSPLLLALLLIGIIWFALHNPEAKEPGWLIIGLFLALYALSVPIAIVWLTLFNIKFGLPSYEQT